MRLILIGAGAGVLRLHMPGIEAIGAEVAGVQDLDRERALAAAEKLGCPAYERLDDLLALEADVAVVMAPHVHHADLAVACLRAGHHVLLEKPLATAPADADRILEEVERCGLLLAVALQQRTREEIREARRAIVAGELGQPQRIDLLAAWPRRSSYFTASPWRGSWRGEGGGALLNQGYHDLDLLCYLVGAPRRVTAWTRTRLQPIETEDTVAGLLEWSDGALGSVRITTAEADAEQRIEITGSGGRLRIEPGRLRRWRAAVDFRDFAAAPGHPYAHPAFETIPECGGGGGTHVDVYRNLAAALAVGEPPVASAQDAAETLGLTNALLLSGWLDEAVDLPVAASEYERFLAAKTAASGERVA